MPRDGELVLEDVRIIFKNFAGKEGPYNRAGDRNFAVLLDEKLAKQMDKDGWNVKALRAREEGDPEQPYLSVAVNFKNRPPNIFMVTSRGRTRLDEDTCEMLDYANILTTDLIISPYEWDVNGKRGIKAYLTSIYCTIEEDPLERKYAEMDEARSHD